jgi:hypothetical protein
MANFNSYEAALEQAFKYANDFRIQVAGITKDNSVVTTLECVIYQNKRKNLVAIVDSNWKFVRVDDEYGGWVKGNISVELIPEPTPEPTDSEWQVFYGSY